MAYQKKVWKDLPSEETPLSADGLNNWEKRIGDAFLGALDFKGNLFNKHVDSDFVKGLENGIYETNNTTQGIAGSAGDGYGILIVTSTSGNPTTSTPRELLYLPRVNAGMWRSGVNNNSSGALIWKKIHVETNKGSSLTGGSGLTYSQVMELPIGWSGLAKFSMLTPTIDYYAIKLMASTTGNTSIWVLMAQNDSQIFKYVCFSPNSIIFDKDLLTGNHIKDYVVEQGTTNGTYYEKWNSGKMKMYREFGNLDLGGITWVFPKEFINYPYVNASTSSGSSTQLVIQNVNSIEKDRAVIFFMSSFTQRVGANNVVGVAEGRWK